MLLVALALWLGSGVVVVLAVWGALLRERVTRQDPATELEERAAEGGTP
jgi:hypothetical protein